MNFSYLCRSFGVTLVFTCFCPVLRAAPIATNAIQEARPTVSHGAPAGASDIPWLGINASYFPNLQRDLTRWGVKSIRLNWGWNAPGTPDGPHPLNYDVNKLRTFARDGFHLVGGCNPRGTDANGKQIEDADFETWVANYKNYCRAVIKRFSSPGDVMIGSYICGNETDQAEPSTGNLTPYQAVRFTRALWEAKNEINPAIQVESAPVSRPDTAYLREMIDLGVANWCDVIGIHAYSDQMDDDKFRAPWDYLRAVGQKKPISISESGVPLRTDWGPKQISDVAWRERWHALSYLQAKRFGYDRLLLFTYDGGDSWTDQWAYVDRKNNNAPIATAYNEVKNGLTRRVFANGGFENPNDRRHEWIPIQPVNAPNEPTWADFSGNTARSGKHSLEIKNGLESRYVKRIAPDLKVGKPYILSAWAKVSRGGTAILAAQGYNRLDGLEERSARTDTNANGANANGANASKRDGWQQLKVRFVSTNPWVVISLGAAPASSGQTNWDDVSVAPALN